MSISLERSAPECGVQKYAHMLLEYVCYDYFVLGKKEIYSIPRCCERTKYSMGHEWVM